jgi:itaconyl-CoA hydratase
MSDQPSSRFFEDFRAGDVYVHRARRVATETDRVWFSALTMNQHELHVGSGDGRGVVPVTWTLAVVVGLSVEDVSWNATANLAWADVTFPAPVLVGDVVEASTVVVATDPDAGTVTATTTGTNQDGATVAVVTRTIAVRRRPSPTGEGAR